MAYKNNNTQGAHTRTHTRAKDQTRKNTTAVQSKTYHTQQRINEWSNTRTEYRE